MVETWNEWHEGTDVAVPKEYGRRYIELTLKYLAVDDSFKASNTTAFKLEVEFYDAAPGKLCVEFDGADENAPFSGAYIATS